MTLDNKPNFELYQTVFNTQLLLEMVNLAEIKILFVKTSLVLGHILVIGQSSAQSKYKIRKFNLNFRCQTPIGEIIQPLSLEELENLKKGSRINKKITIKWSKFG